MIYDILVERNLNNNLILKEYSLTYDEEYLQQKRDLMKMFDNISFETKAEDDFVNIVLASSLNDLLEQVVEVEDSKGNIESIVPGKILIDKIEEKI